MALAAGTHLGPYEILAPIGTGGMGEVCRARFFGNAIPLTEAPSAAHEKGVTRRGLRPGNVMVTELGVRKC